MFLPFRIPYPKPLAETFQKLPRWSRIAVAFVGYLAVLFVSIESIELVEAKSIDSLYKYSTNNSVTVSVVEMTPEKIRSIINTAMANNEVQKRLDTDKEGTKFLNYVLPSEWYIPELPMQIRGIGEHYQPISNDRNLYKILFNEAVLRPTYQGKPFLTQIIKRTPVVEVTVDISKQKVISIKNPPSSIMYDNIPEAIY
jgi:hypothetical protein